jgi:Putative zinc-finger
VIHVTVQQLSSYLDGQLAEASQELVRQHVAACEECAAKLKTMERTDETLTQLLDSRPDAPFLDRLVSEVESGIGGSKRPAATAGSSAPEQPPRAAAAPFQAMPAPAPAKPRPVSRPATAARTAAAPIQRSASRGSSAALWFIVFSLALIAGSAGIVLSRSAWVQSWLDLVDGKLSGHRGLSAAQPIESKSQDFDLLPPSDPNVGDSTLLQPVPDRSAKRSPNDLRKDDEMDWENGAPAPPDPSSEPTTMRADESLPAPPPDDSAVSQDPFGSLRADLQTPLRVAERLSREASLDPTAGRYDTAARAWEHAIEGMGGLPEQVVARERLADSRYRAWVALPDAVHAQQAEEALRSYLLFAPAGAVREQAKARLEQLH